MTGSSALLLTPKSPQKHGAPTHLLENSIVRAQKMIIQSMELGYDKYFELGDIVRFSEVVSF
jgi:hypothetical protein